MTRLLIIAASLSVAASAAYACDFHTAGHAMKVDDTKVASVSKDEKLKMSTPSTADTASTVVLDGQTAIPAKTE